MIPNSNLRHLLIGIGVSQFNATMVIPYLLISPATTDPKAGQIILLVQHLQRALYDLGATDVARSGRLDRATARSLAELVGPGWEGMPWSASVGAVVRAKASGQRLVVPPAAASSAGTPVAVGGPLDFLPDVPGGVVTYAVVGYLLYRHLQARKAAR